MSQQLPKRFPELASFVAAVRRAYGEELVGIYLFGSRARGDHRPDSDYDVAVVLRNLNNFWSEQSKLADIAYESMLGDGVHIQPFPFSEEEWREGNPRDLAGSARQAALELAR